MRCLVLILCSLMLAGCFTTPIVPEYRRATVQVTWTEHAPADLAAICGKAEPGRQVLACASISASGPCTIYTHHSPALETLGHEALHCFTGRWHR